MGWNLLAQFAGSITLPCGTLHDAIFDDRLPAGDGLMEAGHHVPLDRLAVAMEDWFRRKGHLTGDERLRITEMTWAVHGAEPR